MKLMCSDKIIADTVKIDGLYYYKLRKGIPAVGYTVSFVYEVGYRIFVYNSEMGIEALFPTRAFRCR